MWRDALQDTSLSALTTLLGWLAMFFAPTVFLGMTAMALWVFSFVTFGTNLKRARYWRRKLRRVR